MTPEQLAPEHIAPVALFLASDLAADITGAIVGVQGPKIFLYKMIGDRGRDAAMAGRGAPGRDQGERGPRSAVAESPKRGRGPPIREALAHVARLALAAGLPAL